MQEDVNLKSSGQNEAAKRAHETYINGCRSLVENMSCFQLHSLSLIVSGEIYKRKAMGQMNMQCLPNKGVSGAS